MKSIKILALSGSLRTASYNTAAIKALQILAPDNVDIVVGSIADLPLFNPDIETEFIPALEAFISAVKNADALVIASPEYAHGISGSMKNALDWLVSCVDFPYKQIMLINTSPRASHAQNSLREVLKTMSAVIVEKACVSIPLLGSGLGVEGIVNSHEIAGTLTTGLHEFCLDIEAKIAMMSESI